MFNGYFSKNGSNCMILLFFSISICNNFHYTEPKEKRMSDLMFLLFIKKMLACFIVGQEPELEPHKNDALHNTENGFT
jgi:hypothetical protein